MEASFKWEHLLTNLDISAPILSYYIVLHIIFDREWIKGNLHILLVNSLVINGSGSYEFTYMFYVLCGASSLPYL